ncbi:hypothetical protein Tco_1531373 [Tanacetum coccineum]
MEKIVLIKQRIQAASGSTKEATRICNVESRWSSKLGIGLCLKVSPWKGVVRFGKRVMSLEGIHVDDKLQFVEEPVEIIELEIKRLKRSRIPFVKVRWNSRRGPEFTWEREDSFKQKYPQLFTYRATSSTTSNALGYSTFRCDPDLGVLHGISEVGYGIRDTWVDLAEAVPEIAPMTMGEVNTRVTEFAELHEHDTQDLYALLEDAQDMWMVEEEAYASREAWAHSIGLSQAAHQKLQTHRDHVHDTRFQMQHAEIAALQETDHRRQAQMVETLYVIRDMRREMGDMQAELLALREQQRRARQLAPDARIPDHQDASGDADSHV